MKHPEVAWWRYLKNPGAKSGDWCNRSLRQGQPEQDSVSKNKCQFKKCIHNLVLTKDGFYTLHEQQVILKLKSLTVFGLTHLSLKS